MRQVADRLTACMREEDTVARIGGDEFIILLENIGEPTHVVVAAEKILDNFASPFQLQEREVFISPVSVSASIPGMAVIAVRCCVTPTRPCIAPRRRGVMVLPSIRKR